MLHDQVMQTLDRPEGEAKESGEGESRNKGWIVNDPWRGDHVLDAWIYTMWTIMSDQISAEHKPESSINLPLVEQQNALKYIVAKQEAKELGINSSSEKIFESIFGRSRKARTTLGRPGYYSNES
jgi:hypothetical protein